MAITFQAITPERDGMSKEFRQFINGLVKEHNFSHPIEAGLRYDK